MFKLVKCLCQVFTQNFVEHPASGEVIKDLDDSTWKGLKMFVNRTIEIWCIDIKRFQGRASFFVIDNIYGVLYRIADTGDADETPYYTTNSRAFGPVSISRHTEYGSHYGNVKIELFGYLFLSVGYNIYHFYWAGAPFYSVTYPLEQEWYRLRCWFFNKTSIAIGDVPF